MKLVSNSEAVCYYNKIMKNPENTERNLNEVKPGPHTSAELRKIREDFGPGADIALRSIYKSSGYKVTSHRKKGPAKPNGEKV